MVHFKLDKLYMTQHTCSIVVTVIFTVTCCHDSSVNDVVIITNL